MTFYTVQGYLSFWNDNISYALRGCIVIELAFRGRISMQKDASRRRFPLADRVIEVIDDTLTGEVLLDEALKMMKQSEKMSVSSWIDLMSGKATPPFPSLKWNEALRCPLHPWKALWLTDVVHLQERPGT